ncbi:MAG: family 10 glycosylhydrolase [Thermofilaceae archaeon]|nr:family 10 glycosylhydrolase [Thermofilaceae archaeon]MDW8004368.1 family 10 glycosylhydrolase [Thermofilaceae archaeon]
MLRRSKLVKLLPFAVAAAFLFLISFLAQRLTYTDEGSRGGKMEADFEALLREASSYTPFKYKGVYSSVSSKDEVDKLVVKAANSGFNLIIWFVNPRRGPEGVTASYKTSFFPCEKTCEEDLLAYLLERAHERGLKVWAWFGFMGYKSLLERNPSWAAVWPTGETTLEKPCSPGGEKFHVLNPANPQVVEFWRQALVDLVTRYDVDGVNFEDDYGYGYCGENFSYDELNRRMFQAFLEKRGINSFEWPRDALKGGRYYDHWVDYKCEVVSNVTRDLVKTLKTLKPGIEVSLAVMVNREWNREIHGIDWVELGREGLFDYLTFMAYTADDRTLESWVESVHQELNGARSKPIIIIGWELRGYPAINWVKQALVVRRLGGEDLIVFWDGGIERSNAWGYFLQLFNAMGKN